MALVTVSPADIPKPVPQLLRAMRAAVPVQAQALHDALITFTTDPPPDCQVRREEKELVSADERQMYVMALHIARLRVIAAYDHMVSLGRLLGTGDGALSVFSHTSISRDVCEAAVRACWQMDPTISVRKRLLRGLVAWYNGVQDQIRSSKQMPPDFPGHAQIERHLASEEQRFLDRVAAADVSAVLDRRGEKIASFQLGEEKVPVKFTATEEIGAALSGSHGWYSISSAASHASPWVLMDAVISTQNDDFMHLSPNMAEAGAAAMVSIDAAALVIETYGRMYGRDWARLAGQAKIRSQAIDRYVGDEARAMMAARARAS